MKKRLIYYWFIPNKSFGGYFSNTNIRIDGDVDRYVKLHLNCLSSYAGIFDEATFILAKEGFVNDVVVDKVKSDIMRLGFRRLRFVVVDNDPGLCECPMWKKFVIENFDDFDGLTFYCQTKGITHKFENSMVDWVASLYFFNLQYVEQIEQALTNDGTKFISSGIFLSHDNKLPQITIGNGIDYRYIYSGNVYWINQNRLAEWFKYIGKRPEDYLIDTRWSAEAFFAHTFPREYAHSIGNAVDEWDDYRDCISHIFNTVGEQQIKDYLDFKYNIALRGITL